MSELVELMYEREWKEAEREEREEKARVEKERREAKEAEALERKKDRDEFKQMMQEQATANKEALKAMADAQKSAADAAAKAATAASAASGTGAQGNGTAPPPPPQGGSTGNWRTALAHARGPRQQNAKAPIDPADWTSWVCSKTDATKIVKGLKLKKPFEKKIKDLAIDEIGDTLESEWKIGALRTLHTNVVGEDALSRWDKADVVVSLVAHITEN